MWLCINAFCQRYQKGTLRDAEDFNVNSENGWKSISMKTYAVPKISSIPSSRVELVIEINSLI